MIILRKFTLILMLVGITASGCSNWSKAAKGGAIGAGTGGAVGGAIGSRSGNTGAGILIGAAVGGVAGAAIGRYMDKQKKEIEEELPNAEVERVGEGIKVVFDSGILFDVNKADLRQASRESLDAFSETLKKYIDTELVIQGHTDATGSHKHNMTLSDRRSSAVANYLIGKGVARGRLTTQGFGPDVPVADNSTVEGRQKNRRVEILIAANEKLKEEAAAGKLD